MEKLKVIGINVLDRIKETNHTQNILTKHAQIIKTRLGFHELNQQVCSRNAFIILELKGNKEQWEALEDDLNNIRGIQIQTMLFDINN